MGGRAVDRARHPATEHASRWEGLRRAVFDRAAWRCEACGKPGALECDHRQPLFRGGARWDAANLQALCRACHLTKTKRERGRGAPGPGARAWAALVGRW